MTVSSRSLSSTSLNTFLAKAIVTFSAFLITNNPGMTSSHTSDVFRDNYYIFVEENTTIIILLLLVISRSAIMILRSSAIVGQRNEFSSARYVSKKLPLLPVGLVITKIAAGLKRLIRAFKYAIQLFFCLPSFFSPYDLVFSHCN